MRIHRERNTKDLSTQAGATMYDGMDDNFELFKMLITAATCVVLMILAS